MQNYVDPRQVMQYDANLFSPQGYLNPNANYYSQYTPPTSFPLQLANMFGGPLLGQNFVGLDQNVALITALRTQANNASLQQGFNKRLMELVSNRTTAVAASIAAARGVPFTQKQQQDLHAMVNHPFTTQMVQTVHAQMPNVIENFFGRHGSGLGIYQSAYNAASYRFHDNGVRFSPEQQKSFADVAFNRLFQAPGATDNWGRLNSSEVGDLYMALDRQGYLGGRAAVNLQYSDPKFFQQGVTDYLRTTPLNSNFSADVLAAQRNLHVEESLKRKRDEYRNYAANSFSPRAQNDLSIFNRQVQEREVARLQIYRQEQEYNLPEQYRSITDLQKGNFDDVITAIENGESVDDIKKKFKSSGLGGDIDKLLLGDKKQQTLEALKTLNSQRNTTNQLYKNIQQSYAAGFKIGDTDITTAIEAAKAAADKVESSDAIDAYYAADMATTDKNKLQGSAEYRNALRAIGGDPLVLEVLRQKRKSPDAGFDISEANARNAIISSHRSQQMSDVVKRETETATTALNAGIQVNASDLNPVKQSLGQLADFNKSLLAFQQDPAIANYLQSAAQLEGTRRQFDDIVKAVGKLRNAMTDRTASPTALLGVLKQFAGGSFAGMDVDGTIKSFQRTFAVGRQLQFSDQEMLAHLSRTQQLGQQLGVDKETSARAAPMLLITNEAIKNTNSFTGVSGAMDPNETANEASANIMRFLGSETFQAVGAIERMRRASGGVIRPGSNLESYYNASRTGKAYFDFIDKEGNKSRRRVTKTTSGQLSEMIDGAGWKRTDFDSIIATGREENKRVAGNLMSDVDIYEATKQGILADIETNIYSLINPGELEGNQLLTSLGNDEQKSKAVQTLLMDTVGVLQDSDFIARATKDNHGRPLSPDDLVRAAVKRSATFGKHAFGDWFRGQSTEQRNKILDSLGTTAIINLNKAATDGSTGVSSIINRLQPIMKGLDAEREIIAARTEQDIVEREISDLVPQNIQELLLNKLLIGSTEYNQGIQSGKSHEDALNTASIANGDVFNKNVATMVIEALTNSTSLSDEQRGVVQDYRAVSDDYLAAKGETGKIRRDLKRAEADGRTESAKWYAEELKIAEEKENRAKERFEASKQTFGSKFNSLYNKSGLGNADITSISTKYSAIENGKLVLKDISVGEDMKIGADGEFLVRGEQGQFTSKADQRYFVQEMVAGKIKTQEKDADGKIKTVEKDGYVAGGLRMIGTDEKGKFFYHGGNKKVYLGKEETKKLEGNRVSGTSLLKLNGDGKYSDSGIYIMGGGKFARRNKDGKLEYITNSDGKIMTTGSAGGRAFIAAYEKGQGLSQDLIDGIGGFSAMGSDVPEGTDEGNIKAGFSTPDPLQFSDAPELKTDTVFQKRLQDKIDIEAKKAGMGESSPRVNLEGTVTNKLFTDGSERLNNFVSLKDKLDPTAKNDLAVEEEKKIRQVEAFIRDNEAIFEKREKDVENLFDASHIKSGTLRDRINSTSEMIKEVDAEIKSAGSIQDVAGRGNRLDELKNKKLGLQEALSAGLSLQESKDAVTSNAKAIQDLKTRASNLRDSTDLFKNKFDISASTTWIRTMEGLRSGDINHAADTPERRGQVRALHEKYQKLSLEDRKKLNEVSDLVIKGKYDAADKAKGELTGEALELANSLGGYINITTNTDNASSISTASIEAQKRANMTGEITDQTVLEALAAHIGFTGGGDAANGGQMQLLDGRIIPADNTEKSLKVSPENITTREINGVKAIAGMKFTELEVDAMLARLESLGPDKKKAANVQAAITELKKQKSEWTKARKKSTSSLGAAPIVSLDVPKPTTQELTEGTIPSTDPAKTSTTTTATTPTTTTPTVTPANVTPTTGGTDLTSAAASLNAAAINLNQAATAIKLGDMATAIRSVAISPTSSTGNLRDASTQAGELGIIPPSQSNDIVSVGLQYLLGGKAVNASDIPVISNIPTIPVGKDPTNKQGTDSQNVELKADSVKINVEGRNFNLMVDGVLSRLGGTSSVHTGVHDSLIV
jgi:hypothetical protein